MMVPETALDRLEALGWIPQGAARTCREDVKNGQRELASIGR